jgi:hypothetical protein
MCHCCDFIDAGEIETRAPGEERWYNPRDIVAEKAESCVV